MGDVPLDRSRSPPREMTPNLGQQGELPTKISSSTTRSVSGPGQATQPSVDSRKPAGSQASRPSPLNLSGMATALPSYAPHSAPYPQQPIQQQFISPHSLAQPAPMPNQGPGIVYQVQNVGQYPAQVLPGSPPHGFQYPHQFSYYQHQHVQYGAVGYQHVLPGSPTHMVGLTPVQQPHYDPSFQCHQTHQPYSTFAQRTLVPQGVQHYHYGQNTSHSYPPKNQKPGTNNKRDGARCDMSNIIVDGSRRKSTGGVHSQTRGKGDTSSQRTSPVPVGTTILRAPSRKPRQSGHALWVGNLPPGANIIDLRDHFFQDPNNCIESVFLISKSNCAFVNYKTDEACVEAMNRFHDSRFQGIKLVCRLRRGSVRLGSGTITTSSNPQPEGNSSDGDTEQETKTETTLTKENRQGSSSKVKDRYFVVKSLTIADLELSRESGVWATQIHNEDVLNQAYQSAENVYLIFSANKTGEYFGYARMASSIDESEAESIEMPPRPENAEKEHEPAQVTETPATALAPKGRIVDDIARGTVFWEAEEVHDEEAESDSKSSDKSVEESEEGSSATQTFGKPFRIEWVCVERLPFYRTRGLRNPWNANREVKIARDGTEIEPSVGMRLTQLFHLHPGSGCPTGPSAGTGNGGTQL